MEDSIYGLRHRDMLALCVIGLLLLGVVMVHSAAMSVQGVPAGTSVREFVESNQSQIRWQWNERGSRHMVYAMLAIATFFIVGNLNYTNLIRERSSIWRSPILWMVAVAAFTCLIVLIPHVGIERNGARRWLPLGIAQVQPSELAKWGTVLLLAWMIAQRPIDIDRFNGFLIMLAPIGAMTFLVVLQDFGTAALISLCTLTLLIAGRIHWKHLAIIIPPAICAAVWFVMSEPYRWKRMTAFLNPWADPQGEGYHMVQSLLSFATGGLGGRGLGNGIQKLGYLPEDTTDFIFAVICEELGIFGALLTILLYLGILYVAWQVIRRCREPFGQMLAMGIGAMIGLQALINIAVATVSVPTKGLSLPLVSAGGSGLIITCAALGLLYSISRMEPAESSMIAGEGDVAPIRPVTA